MKTISQAVSEYIKSKPFLSSALSDGIINFTSLSRKIKPDLEEILRKKLSFNGLIFSDDLSMEGTNDYKNFYDKAKKSIISGCEMILICNNREGVKDALKYFEEENIKPSEKCFSVLMSSDLSWSDLEKNKDRDRIINNLNKLT